MTKAADNEQHWQPLPRQYFTVQQMLGIVVRHLIPACGVPAFGWSGGQLLLIGVFNVCFSIVSIGTLGPRGAAHSCTLRS